MGRVEYFVSDDGTAATLADGGVRRTVDPGELARAWLAETRAIPVQFAIGTAQHESNFTINEHDIEESGVQTFGIFQLSEDDKWLRARKPWADWYTLTGSCAIFAAVCEGYLARILDAADAWNMARGWPPIDRTSPPPDVWAYLALAHNQGIGSTSGTKGALGTIARYGLDWTDYKRRNAGQPWGAIATDRGSGIYGDDVISGGASWADEYARPFDASGAEIPAPLVGALTSARVRLGLLSLLVLLIAYAVATRGGPAKGVI